MWGERGIMNKEKNKFRKVAIVQARMSSTRLPGKVLLPLGTAKIPALQYLIESLKILKSIQRIYDIYVATTNNPADEAIVELCKEIGCKYFRGSEEDVMERMRQTALISKADVIIDITGDCPLFDISHVWQCLDKLFLSDAVYSSNVAFRTWPDGFDVQCYYFYLFEILNGIVKDPKHRSHTGWNIIKYQNEIEKQLNKKILIVNHSAPEDRQYPEWRLTLDTEEDYQVINQLICEMEEKNISISADSIITYIEDHPYILDANRKIVGKIPGEG